VCGSNRTGAVHLDWTPTPSSYATGYVITRAVGTAAPTTLATLPSTATQYDDATVTGSRTYTYSVASTYRGWTSATVTASVTTPKKC
jgi:hypothetical protein